MIFLNNKHKITLGEIMKQFSEIQTHCCSICMVLIEGGNLRAVFLKN